MSAQQKRRPRALTAVAIVCLGFGLSMFGYWTLYFARGMPAVGIPIGSELINACVAVAAAIGMLKLRRWGYALGLLAAGMWIYGLTGGIGMVLEKGLAFESPIGALSDAILFVVVLAFAITMAGYLYRKRELFA